MGLRAGRGSKLIGIAAAIGAMILPAAAHADVYVDNGTGTDDAGCGAIGDPCDSIDYAVINSAGAGEAVRIDDGPAYGPVSTLGDGISLIGHEFVGGDEGLVVIQGGGSWAVRVLAGDPAGTIQGLSLRSTSATNSPLFLFDEATVTGNNFDDDGDTCDVSVYNAGNNSTISSNSFSDPSPTVTPKSGVCIQMDATPTVTGGNFFTSLNRGVSASGGDATISFNVFTDTRAMHAIGVGDGAPTITANVILAPGDATAGGIFINSPGGASLRRNLIFGHAYGVNPFGNDVAVELIGDLIANSTSVGLVHADPAGGSTSEGDVNATNVTIYGSGSTEIQTNDAALTLNSSIIGASGTNTLGAAPTCSISFSRGPTPPGAVTVCPPFQTSADPLFVNPLSDFHLSAGSPMIDMGDPAPPPGDILDFDSQTRATDGNGDGIARRDIGADETAGVPGPTLPPAAVPAKKKCRKGFKLKKVKTKRGKKKKRCVRRKRRRR